MSISMPSSSLANDIFSLVGRTATSSWSFETSMPMKHVDTDMSFSLPCKCGLNVPNDCSGYLRQTTGGTTQLLYGVHHQRGIGLFRRNQVNADPEVQNESQDTRGGAPKGEPDRAKPQ